jgi:hypothetical protein
VRELCNPRGRFVPLVAQQPYTIVTSFHAAPLFLLTVSRIHEVHGSRTPAPVGMRPGWRLSINPDPFRPIMSAPNGPV